MGNFLPIKRIVYAALLGMYLGAMPSALAQFADPFDNTVTVTMPTGVTDPDLTNNSSTDSNTLDAVTDITIVKDDSATEYTPGGNTVYTITVTNAGPSDARDVDVADTLPTGVTLNANVTCTANGTATCGTLTNGMTGDGSFSSDGGTIGAGAGNSLVYSVSVDYAADMTADPVVNTASAVDADDPDGQQTDTDSNDLNAITDLTIAKDDGSTTYTPGESTTYTITVTNDGPSDAMDVDVADTLPTGLTLNADVTCTANGNATCGTLSDGTTGDTSFSDAGGTIDSGAGNSLVYTVSVDFDAGMTTDPLVNTASAQDPNDPDGQQTDTDSNTLQLEADISVVKTDGVATYTPGEDTTYTITISNAGPSNVVNANVVDNLPNGVTLNTQWTCDPSAGAGGGTASCVSGDPAGTTANGGGNINLFIDIPAGETLEIEVPVTYSSNPSDY